MVKQKKTRVPKTCPICGKKFLFEGRRYYYRKYCSFKCSNSHHDFVAMGRKGGLAPHKCKTGPKDSERETRGECLARIGSKGGIASAKLQAERNRSQGEAYLALLLRRDGYKVIQNTWDLVPGYEVDIWLPNLNVAICYNGAVHYKPIYGEGRLRQVRQRDRYRHRKLTESGIKHIIVREWERYDKRKVAAKFAHLKKELGNPVQTQSS